MQLSDLLDQHCTPKAKALPGEDTAALLKLLPDWDIVGIELIRVAQFKNYYETMAFVNALAFIAHAEDHHPDLGVHYNRCEVRWSTHDAGGLTLNDFICAARTQRLLTR